MRYIYEQRSVAVELVQAVASIILKMGVIWEYLALKMNYYSFSTTNRCFPEKCFFGHIIYNNIPHIYQKQNDWSISSQFLE